MSLISIGDLSQHFVSLRNSHRIKSDLSNLGNELSTGKRADLTKSLGGDTRRLTALGHSLGLNQSYMMAAKNAQQMLAATQNVLLNVDNLRDVLATDLILATPESQTGQLTESAAAARAGFSSIVAALNGTSAGQGLFAGTLSGGAAVADADIMLADMISNITDTGDPVVVKQAVDDWFDDPSGGFQTLGFLGNTNARSIRIGSAGHSVKLNVFANDKELRSVLKSAALGAVVHDLGGSVSRRDRGALLADAGLGLVGSAQGIAQIQSRVGHQEAGVARTVSGLAAQQTTMSIALNSLEAADPFETATRLEATQRQLELHFTATARLSQLTLADYI